MKNIIVIPDSFKGTLSSIEVCDVVGSSIEAACPDFKVLNFPVADGGEGTVDCFLRIKDGKRIDIQVTGPDMSPVDSYYGIFGDTAVIEMAAAAGYSLRTDGSSPLNTTTYGVGELVRDAINRACKTIIIGLGGSCTNDGGAGMAAALGTRFYDSDGDEFIPVGGTLSKVAAIDQTETSQLLNGINIIGMCDVTNPMYGPDGAAYVFAPQKGASPDDVVLLDNELGAFSETIRKSLDIDVSTIEGGGAAGALGAGIYAFLSGKLVKGIDVILNMIDFETLVKDASYVITGEGKFDSQSLSGKVVSGVCDAAKRANTPVIVVTGTSEVSSADAAKLGVSAVFETGQVD